MPFYTCGPKCEKPDIFQLDPQQKAQGFFGHVGRLSITRFLVYSRIHKY